MASTTPGRRLALRSAQRVSAAGPRFTHGADGLPRIPPAAIIAVALGTAIICGRFFADGRIKYGAALVLAALYAPLVFFNLPAAFALWAAILFIKDLHALSVGPNAIGVLVGLGFIGMFAGRVRRLPVLRQQRRLLIGVTLFLIWLTVSAAWAPLPGTAASSAGFWWLAGLAFLISMSALSSPRDIGLVAVAFVVGATMSAVLGLASGGLNSAAAGVGQTTTSLGQTALNGRLTGGGGDPNLQAAGFIAAMYLAMGLFSVYRRRLARVGLLVAFVLVTVAFFLTESRGGLLALGVTTVSALILFKGQRRRILGFVLVAVVVAGVAISASPGSLARITDFGGGTSGRSDLWAVAEKVIAQHPLVGVGLANFEAVEPRFSLLHKTVSRVTYIAETPEPAHNTYLQLWAENGILGLVGYLAVAFFSLRSAWKAAQIFDRAGYTAYAQLARTAMMGTIGMLAAVVFFTDGNDWRIWILFGLGPALLALARRSVPTTAQAAPLPA